MRSWKQLKRLVLTLLSVGGVVAVLGLLQKVSGATKHYWFWESAAGAFGPFMNYDQFASYMAMVLPMGLGYLGANSSRPIRAIAWPAGDGVSGCLQ